MRTYFSLPELSPLNSSEVVLPYSVPGPPSITGLFVWFTRALPQIIKPPQSPVTRLPGSLSEVKTIGLSTVPSAMIFAPGSIIKEAAFSPEETDTPLITVPASIVNVAPGFT